MKVIFNTDRNIAIPVDTIKAFRIIHHGYVYEVEAIYYLVYTEIKTIVFRSDSREECEEFIENI